MLHQILITILIIFYIVISNYLVLDERIHLWIDKGKYSYYIIVFILAGITLYVQNDNLQFYEYIIFSIIVTAFFKLIPFVKLDRSIS